MQKVQVITGPYVFSVRAFFVLFFTLKGILLQNSCGFAHYKVYYLAYVCFEQTISYVNERTEHK